jgi:adenylosuccinate synthase
MSSIKRLTDRLTRWGARTVAVVDNQWGDAGKGKIVDSLAEWADIIARGTGGANAGHTIIIGGETHVFHLVPSGILWDGQGKVNVIGRGVAVEPCTLAGEIGELAAVGNHCAGLRISHHAHLVLPIDIALDRLKEAGAGASAIGTTGRGIGPVYESWLARIGLTANDLLNKDVFAKKLSRNWAARKWLFKQYDPEVVKAVLGSEALESGVFYGGSEKVFDLDAIVERYTLHAKTFRDMLVDTDVLMARAVGRKNVLLEGAQGVLLSVSYGTYPYVTSSDCSLAGLAEGVGLRTRNVDYVLSVVKAPYMTRVGKGPFPTELGGHVSAEWCSTEEARKGPEREKYPQASVNSSDSLEQGVAIRQAGNEYGATTGRPRRVGWLDLPLLRYAAQYGSSKLALTKVDVLNDCKVIWLCVQYRYEGDDYRVGDRQLRRGDFLGVAIMDAYVMEHCTPVYLALPGWCRDLSGIRSVEDLPPELLSIVGAIESRANVTVDVLSIGPDRNETIVF